jgi:hypothetical protein
MGKRGRPKALPVSDQPLTDSEAFWRLKAAGFDSYQATRTIGFCASWQRLGGSVDTLAASGLISRASVYNRLRECHVGGFEPDLVRIKKGDIDSWAAMERTMAEQIKREANDLPPLPRIIRWAFRAERYPHLEDEGN